MRRSHQALFSVLLLTALLLAYIPAYADDPSFKEVPGVLRPGKYYSMGVEVPYSGNMSLLLLDAQEQPRYTIYSGYPVNLGYNKLGWDGRLADHTIVEQGEYILRLEMDDGTHVDSPLRVGEPYPMLMGISQSDYTLGDKAIWIDFTASDPGTLTVQIMRSADGSVTDLFSSDVTAGGNSFEWNGETADGRMQAGEYALMMTLRTVNGMESMTEYVYMDVSATAESATFASEGFQMVDVTPAPQADPTPVPVQLSPPYSETGGDTFWGMNPGELDDAVIWDILMQPVTVYDDGTGMDGGRLHAYLMENPDGSGKKVAQIHGMSHGVHVIGETNEHGYVLVETFSDYDRDYSPETEEERAHAYDLKRGYLKAKNLKTVNVQTDMALLVDKLTQRMYLFKNGTRVTEFLISTGIWEDPKDMLFETVPGEFITISHTGTLKDGNMNSSMAIRINGGILFHEVPHKLNADGSHNYSSFEGYLGQKKSHGCIRVQRLKTPEGYNQQWLWDNFKRGAPYKVIIWDDKNRMDSPSTWQANPTNY